VQHRQEALDLQAVVYRLNTILNLQFKELELAAVVTLAAAQDLVDIFTTAQKQ
jgi:hypothetical protein